MATQRQRAAYQIRRMASIIDKVEQMSEQWADLDGMMESETEGFLNECRAHLAMLEEYKDELN